MTLFRYIAILEGISYLLLLGIAMPLKYWFELPIYVQVIGMAHGVLFIAYCILLPYIHFKFKWPIFRSILAFIASLLPFGTFYVERKWLR